MYRLHVVQPETIHETIMYPIQDEAHIRILKTINK